MMQSHDLDDARLLAETAHEASAFAEFYERYEESVLVYMLRRTSSPELAADLTAEVFASALEGASRFRFTGVPPAAWLFRIARNVLVDSYRDARVQDSVRRRLGMPQLLLTDDVADHLERLASRAEGGVPPVSWTPDGLVIWPGREDVCRCQRSRRIRWSSA